MKMFDIECRCGAQYRCAESETLAGRPGSFVCTSCGQTVERWDTATTRVYRCMLSPDRAYMKVAPPPAP